MAAQGRAASYNALYNLLDLFYHTTYEVVNKNLDRRARALLRFPNVRSAIFT